MAEREIVLLSGMHRSGTSALARVFNLLGAKLPGPLVPPSLGNELGHWEPAEAVAMNDAALLAAGSDVNSLHPLSAEWLGDGRAEAFTEQVRAWLERAAPPGALTVVKDPRISLLAPFWRDAVERLGARPRFVVSWRDPWEVARSLSRRQLEHFPYEVWPHARVELLWLKHQLELERASRGALRSFTAYASLLEDWRPVVGRLYSELQLAPPGLSPAAEAAVDAFLRPEAHRQRRPETAEAPDATVEVLKLLEARVGRPDGGARAFDRAAARFHDAVRLLGGYLGALETRVATDAELTADGVDTRVLIAALAESAAAAERRAAETLAPRRSSRPTSPDEALGLEDLRNRHEGLRLAHARAVDERATLIAEHERAVDERATLIAEHERDRREAQRSHATRVRRAEAHLLEQTERAERAEGDAMRARDEVARLNTRIEALDVEVEDHRAAFEALRLEAARVRGQLAKAGARELRVGSVGRDAQLNALLRAEAAALSDELAALRASASWRLTRPLRSVTFRLRRLVRR